MNFYLDQWVEVFCHYENSIIGENNPKLEWFSTWLCQKGSCYGNQSLTVWEFADNAGICERSRYQILSDKMLVKNLCLLYWVSHGL